MSRQLGNNSRGADLARQFYAGRKEADSALLPGARQLPMLHGLNPHCEFTEPQANVLAAAGVLLVASERVFAYGDTVVLERQSGNEKVLTPLITDQRTERAAPALLANVFTCEVRGRENGPALQFPPPARFVELLLHYEQVISRLPRILLYAKRPVFDESFIFRGPGRHDEVGYLIHGPDVEPILDHEPTPSGTALSRLPPRLRELMRDFAFMAEADLTNAIGALLTGLLVGHFIQSGKGVIILDSNQPGLGKTLLVRVIGTVLDGADPEMIRFTPDDEELEKKICAHVRGNRGSVLAFDNAKVRAGGQINSAVLELNSTAPQISLRILGQSANATCPNDLLWFLTMNSTRASSDLIARSMPIRFFVEGESAQRTFQGRDPVEFARQHREEILGELAGMVVRWTQLGRPRGHQRHRLKHWAEIIGGILAANELPEFLANSHEAAGEFNSELDQLSALAEAAVLAEGSAAVQLGVTVTGSNSNPSLTASAFEKHFRQAGVLIASLDAAKGQRSKATIIGGFLAQHIDREVPIEVAGTTGKATLRCVRGRSNSKRYYFAVTWDDELGGVAASTRVPPTAPDRPLPSIQVGQGAVDDPVRHEPGASTTTNTAALAAANHQGNDEAW